MKPLNGSWLFNVDFEEIDTALTYAKFEKNKVTKQPDLESVIKNKFLQEITMETKFKVGDKVLLTKPKDTKTDELIWFPKMDKYVGEVFVVKDIGGRVGRYYCTNNEIVLFLCESWLTKIEEQPTEQVIEQVTEQVAKPIDWEARRWEMASKIFAETEDITLDSAVRQADIFIKYYKQTLK